MNGVFSFPSNRPYNAADPSTYPERLSVLVPGPDNFKIHSHGFGMFAQDKWAVTRKLTFSLGVRYDVDIAPIKEEWNPLFSIRTTPRPIGTTCSLGSASPIARATRW